MSNKILLLHRTWFLLCFPYSIGTEFMVWRQVSRKSRTQMWILKKNKNSLSIQKQHLNNQQSNSHAEKNKLYVLYHYFVSRYGFCCSSVNSPHSKQRTDNEWTKKWKNIVACVLVQCLCESMSCYKIQTSYPLPAVRETEIFKCTTYSQWSTKT